MVTRAEPAGGAVGMADGSSRPPTPPAEGTGGAVSASSGAAPASPGSSADGSVAGDGAGVAVSNSTGTSSSAGGSRGRPGSFRSYSVPHAVGWAVGSAVGSTQRTVAKAFNSSGSAAEEEV